jgi:signal transduction histidine kinase
VTHVLDLSFFTLFIYFTAGPSSPFTVYFLFSLVCASLRWGWRGVLTTAAVALGAFAATGAYFALALRDPRFELQSFIIRGVYLAVIAVLLGYLGAHEQRTRREMSLLAGWPPRLSGEPRLLARELLQHAASVVGAPQAVLVWNDADEPWVQVASWHRGAFTHARHAPAAIQPVVRDELSGCSFLRPSSGDERALVRRTPEGFAPWEGSPLHRLVEEQCAPGSVLGLPLHAETFDGWLLLVGKPLPSVDDLVLGEVVAGVVAARLEQSFLMARLQEQAATEERIRLARDLHDGVLQSLTGIALRLVAVRRQLAHDPAEGAVLLGELQRLIALEQRDLRFYIQELKPSSRPAAEQGSLSGRLAELAGRISREWDLHVELDAEEEGSEGGDAHVQDVYLIVREAVVNAVRHGSASRVSIRLGRPEGGLAVTITDNGRGFPFEGSFSGDELRSMDAGPRSLLERVTALGGSLMLESGRGGARLDVLLPLVGEAN